MRLTVFYSDHFPVPLPARHPFPLEKYALLRRTLLSEGVLRPEELHPAEPVSSAILELAHTRDYLERVRVGPLDPATQRRWGFPWSVELVRRARASVGGTLAAARVALRTGVAGNLAGGTHHAHAAFPSGYCTFNDVAVAVRALQAERLLRRALVVDLDVHQGDGTARFFQDDPRVFTLSLHGEKNFPFRKARSDLDLPLPDGTGDEPYLEALEKALPQAFERARADLAFYLAGADPLACDRLGRLSLTPAGLAARDELVIRACLRRGVPLVLTLSGGYAQPLVETVRAHVTTYRLLRRLGAV